MAEERKVYARYLFNRGLQTLWKGDPAKEGAQFREVAISSDEFNSTQGTFQVYELEGTGLGVKDGKFAGSDKKPRVVFDKDIRGLDEAVKKFTELVKEAEGQGFQRITLIDILEFESKLKK